MKQIEIIIPKKGELNSEEINAITNLINSVYLESESKFWPHNGDYERVNVVEIKSFIDSGELIIAMQSNIIVGAVHVYILKSNVGGFGMLAALSNMRGLKIGSKLYAAVEDWCFNKKLNSIQLEVLKPDKGLHTDKEFLEDWYKRLGYVLKTKNSYGELYPSKKHLQQIDLSFYVYTKNIR